MERTEAKEQNIGKIGCPPVVEHSRLPMMLVREARSTIALWEPSNLGRKCKCKL